MINLLGRQEALKINVNYSNRPSKGLVRSKIFNIIEETFHPLHEHDCDLSFITFSGYRFIDSIEFYKRFNIRNIFSIENLPYLYNRAVFNKPYEFIDITHGRIKDFIDTKYANVIEKKKVIYLDYESKFNDSIIEDIEVLFSSGFFDKESLLFITFNRGFKLDESTKRIYEVVDNKVKSPDAFKIWLSDNFSDYILNLLQKKYRNSKCLCEKIKAFYRDTSNMLIFGYYMKNKDNGNNDIEKVDLEEFCLPELTRAEEHYIRNNLTKNCNDIAEKLGLTEREVKEFIDSA